MWETFNRQYMEQLKASGGKAGAEGETEPPLPAWLDKYVTYKFNLFDRTGNK